jgi:hypothetical protein
MRTSMKVLSYPNAAQQIADMIVETGTASALKEESYG